MGRSFLEELNLLEMGRTPLHGVFMMCQAPPLLEMSVFCSLVVDGEGDKGQRTITNLREEGVVSSADDRGGMETEVGSRFLQSALKTEKRDVFVKEITGDP